MSAIPDNNLATIVATMSDVLDEDQLLTSEEELRPYECDGLSAYKRVPLAVALPETVEQVQTIVRLCNSHNIPVVARGAGTGLSGGALPDENGIVLGLSRFNNILEIDELNQLARVQPGVRNLAISQAAAEYGLYYAPDPSSQIACSIGGNVAENSGGVHCLKYGLTVHNIYEITIVTAEGELAKIGSPALDNCGYDLLGLLTGSEGMLGIIVEITVRLLPKAEDTVVLLAGFDETRQAASAVAAIIADGIIPAGLEMMDGPAIKAAEDFAKAGYPTDADAILLCELDGSKLQVIEEKERTRRILEGQHASTLMEATTATDQARLWAGRKSAFPAVGRISPDYYCMDGTIPRKELPAVLERINELSDEFGLRVANVFHAGDGNLHPLILYDANNDGELEKAEQFGAAILEACVDAGGTITGEHGVGHEKIDQMCYQFNEDELEFFHAIKDAFDARGFLNPGKAVPTLHRCAELGRMHVHNGELPHPDIPRF